MADVRRFDPNQKRDPDGKWGDGVPGPSLPDLDMDGFSLIAEAEGTFGTLRMGVDQAGDVRMAFHEGDEARAVDLSGDEIADLADILNRLAAYRDEELPDDADPSGVYDDDRFGYDNSHYVALHGNGTISITFGTEDDDPWRLVLDPPYEADPDDPDDEDIDDVQAVLDAIDDVFIELDAGEPSRSASLTGGRMNARYNDQHAPAGSANGGQFTSGGGGGEDKKPAPPKRTPNGPRKPRKPTPHADSGTLSYDPNSNHGTGYDSKTGDPRVHALQQALTRLGIKDSSGKELKDDGKLGPKTTSAVKALQKRLGLKADGKVTPALLAQIKSMKSLPAQRRSGVMDMCIRSFGFELEQRGRSNDGRTLEGYAAVFGSPTRIAALGGDFDEVIQRGAFTRSLQARSPVLQWDHGKDPSVGTAPIGDIEELREDDHGLYVRARLYDHPSTGRVRMAIQGRSVKGMSFRFQVPDGGDRWERRSGDVDLRTVADADVFELGPVAFPAYDTTTVSVRSLLAQLGPEEHRALLQELAHDLRSLDLDEFGGRPSARSSGGAGTRQDEVGGQSIESRFAVDDESLRLRGIL